ncbi:MAG: hypothetical protein EP341_05380 [Sphingomonadales bacterium]|nr:MAG: hypothetical protein EP341_05380 [Sphingomonadales bacterium]
MTEKAELIKVLRNGQQCDEDGVMCIVSRKACHDAADALEAEQCAVVKPLEWREVNTKYYEAEDIFGIYAIEHTGDGWFGYLEDELVAYAGKEIVGEGTTHADEIGFATKYECVTKVEAYRIGRLSSVITIRPASEVAAEAKAEAIEAAENEAASYWMDMHDKNKRGPVAAAIRHLHTDATRAALERKGSE